jgi:hypothetical protein
MPYLSLTEDELLALDGKCRQEIQDLVNEAKRKRVLIGEGFPPYLAAIEAHAERDGILTMNSSRGSQCEKCGRHGSASACYKIGAKKGLPNPNKPSVSFEAYSVGGIHLCVGCYMEFQKNIPRLDFTKFEYRIDSKYATLVIWEGKIKCQKCGHTSWEFDANLHASTFPEATTEFSLGMRQVCPNCNRTPTDRWTRILTQTGEWRLVPVELLEQEHREWVRKDGVLGRQAAQKFLEGTEDGPQA